MRITNKYFLFVALALICLLFSATGYALSGGWVKAKDLEIGNSLLLANGEKAVITSIQEANEKAEVYNLAVDENENFFANRVLVHNKAKMDIDLIKMNIMGRPSELYKLSRKRLVLVKGLPDYRHGYGGGMMGWISDHIEGGTHPLVKDILPDGRKIFYSVKEVSGFAGEAVARAKLSPNMRIVSIDIVEATLIDGKKFLIKKRWQWSWERISGTPELEGKELLGGIDFHGQACLP